MSADHHTYLRYECADAFGVTVTTGMEAGDEDHVLTMAGSHVLGWNLKTCQLDFKLGTPDTSTNVGTGQALTSEHVTALVVSGSNNNKIIGTGWNSGSIRVFDVVEDADEKERSLSHSLLETTTSQEQQSSNLMEPRVVFNGHSTAIQALTFGPTSGRLASGCGKGTVVVWDLISETGLYRLLGHKGGITSLQFALNDDYLLSTSLDGLAKVWDLEGQCCVQTLMLGGQQTQIWSSALWSSSTNTTTNSVEENDEKHRVRFLTGGVNGQVLVWKVEQPKRKQKQEGLVVVVPPEEKGDDAMQVDDDEDLDRVCHCMGPLPIDTTIVATNNERIVSIRHSGQRWIGVLHHNSKSVSIYQIRSNRESQRKRQRRLRRRREKQHQKENSTNIEIEDDEKGRKRGFLDDEEEEEKENNDDDEKALFSQNSVSADALKASDEFEFYGMVRASHKIRDFVLLQHKINKKISIKVVCALTTNSLEVHTLSHTAKEEAKKPLMLDMYGHPTGIRSMAISSDHALACTVSKKVTKIWNVTRRSCLLSMTPTVSSSNNSCYGLCVAFLPGNTHVVLGTREGAILILDIQSGTVVFEDVEAHDGAIWGLDICRHQETDGNETTMSITLVTGSADKCVKFWDLEEAEDSGGHPTLVQTRTLQMSDEVVAVKYSSQFTGESSRMLVFVSTLDSIIKVFFEDSLKLFLSLYGHSLPALCVAVSDDDALLASGSADKTIKVWGLDFGDTHCTLHGHTDSVTDLAFIRRTHCFVTSSKDATIRYWDADRFQQILILEGHSAEIHCVAVTNGAFVLSGGMDRQVRVWERTQDMVFVEEEKERFLEQQFDAQANTDDDRNRGTLSILNNKQRGDDENDDDDMGDEQPQSAAAVRKSVLSVSSGDRIMEALEQADAELARKRRKPDASKNMMLLNLEPAQYVSWVLRTIPSADLEQSLLILTLRHMERLFFYLISNLKNGREVELSCRVAIFLVTTHQRQISLHNSLLIPLRELRRLVRLRLSESRDRIGFNLAALRRIGHLHQENKAGMITADTTQNNVWAGLGLGSDVAAALQRNKPTTTT